MRKILVTGACGFIGTNLCQKLLERGDEVYGVDDWSNDYKYSEQNFKKLQKYKNFRLFKRFEEIHKIQYDSLIHYAANPSVHKSIEFPLEAHEVNLTLTIKYLELARQLKIPQFIFASSCSVYGNQKNPSEYSHLYPMSPYAYQKMLSEKYCELYRNLYNINTIIVRFFNVFGPNQNGNSPYSCLIPKFITRALYNSPLTIYGDGQQTRDFIDVDSVNDGVLLIMGKHIDNNYESQNENIYNISSGKELSVNKVTMMILQETKSKSEIVNLPPIEGEPKNIVGNSEKLNSLGWFRKNTFLNALKKQIEQVKDDKNIH